MATAFLSSLNGGTTGVGNCTSTDGVTQTGGFAGHCDWRLPTVAELKSLFEVTDPSCIDTCSNGNFIGVCDDPTLGPLRTCGPYWTSTSVNPVGGDNSVVWGVGVDPDPQPPLPLVPFLVEENKYASTGVGRRLFETIISANGECAEDAIRFSIASLCELRRSDHRCRFALRRRNRTADSKG